MLQPTLSPMSRLSPHVLIVDDHPLDVELTVLALENVAPHAQVTVLRDAGEALDYLSGTVRPDLTLLDLHMPRVNGLELLARLRASPLTRHLKVVLCSTSNRPEDIEAALALGADGYLVKPPTTGQLEAALQDALRVQTHGAPGPSPQFALR